MNARKGLSLPSRYDLIAGHSRSNSGGSSSRASSIASTKLRGSAGPTKPLANLEGSWRGRIAVKKRLASEPFCIPAILTCHPLEAHLSHGVGQQGVESQLKPMGNL